MENLLVVDQVTKEYPGRKAVDAVSFTVQKGSIHGFLGPNGAGKSTTMRMIAGLMPATAGKISLNGVNPLAAREHIGYLPENAPLYLDMTVEGYLTFVAKIHQVSQLKEKVDRVIEELSLTEVRKRLIGNLSKGYRQRVGLAQAIVYDASFLILDEPTNGLDPQTVVELREFILKLAKEKTILFSSHVLSEVEQLCDTITIIHQGKIRASGNLQEIHKKFRQGLVLNIGLRPGEKLPDLSALGKHEVTQTHPLHDEVQYQVVFEAEKDCRGEISSLLVSKGLSLLTLKIESPELEDIFLHMTEKRL